MTKYVLIHWLVQLNLLTWLSAFGYVAYQEEGSDLFYLYIVGTAISVLLEHTYYRHLYKPWKNRQGTPHAAGRE